MTLPPIKAAVDFFTLLHSDIRSPTFNLVTLLHIALIKSSDLWLRLMRKQGLVFLWCPVVLCWRTTSQNHNTKQPLAKPHYGVSDYKLTKAADMTGSAQMQLLFIDCCNELHPSLLAVNWAPTCRVNQLGSDRWRLLSAHQSERKSLHNAWFKVQKMLIFISYRCQR